MKKAQHVVNQYGRGLMLSAGIALAAIWVAAMPAAQRLGVSPLILAIVFGIGLGNTFFPNMAPSWTPGVDFAKTSLLRLGIILYGFRITFQQIGAIGWGGILIDILIIVFTFALAMQLGTRIFKLDRQTAILIGAGSSICGAAAVMAAEPIVKGQAHKVSVAVSTVVIFGTLAMFIYPLAYPYLQLSEKAYGIYVGSTVHEVAQVVVAGKAVSEQAAAAAVIEKMLRVMMLAPFLLLLSMSMEREAGTAAAKRIVIPWFAVLFVIASGIHSLHLLPQAAVHWIVQADTVLLAMAMSALGLQTQVRAVRQAGLKPLLLAGFLFGFLAIGGYLINRAVSALA